MNNICNVIKPYRCGKCNQDTLFFYTKNNTLIDYKSLFDKCMTLEEIKSFIEDKKIKYIKCISCGKLYIIDWRTGYPIQLLDTSPLKDFGV